MQKIATVIHRVSNIWFVSLFFLALAIFLAISWLPGRVVIGGGDAGIPLHLPQRALQTMSGTWWENQDTGTTNPVTFTALPLYEILAGLSKLGVGSDITQKLFVVLILAASPACIFLIAKKLKLIDSIAWVASLTYVFSFESLNIWHRGVHNGMLLLLALPLTLFLLIQAVENEQYRYILWINLAVFLTSYVYGSPAYVFTLWLVWIIYLGIAFICFAVKRRFIFIFSMLFFVSWVLLNAWWLYYFLESGKYVFAQFNLEEIRQRSSDVVIALKSHTDASSILRSVNKLYLYEGKDWGNWYLSPPIILLSWLPTFVIYLTFLNRQNYKKFSWRFLTALIFLLLIISKGINPPLGWLNKFFYDNISLLTPLRNPYEKVGALLIIPYTLLFGLGIHQIFVYLKNKGFRLAYIPVASITVLCLVVLVWPLWAGRVFGQPANDPKLKIPTYYSQADQWLAPQLDGYRILHLPLSLGESVDYNWGYSGVEPSQLFFDGSSFAYSVSLSGIDNRLKDLVILLHDKRDSEIVKALSSLNIGWVVFHKETDWRARGHESTDNIQFWLDTEPNFLEHEKDFGPLSIYRIKEQYRTPKIYTPTQLISIDHADTKNITESWPKVNNETSAFVYGLDPDAEQTLKNSYSARLVYPENHIKFEGLGQIEKENALKELPYVRIYPDNLLYPLIGVKELTGGFYENQNGPVWCLDLAGKRLVEAYYMSTKAGISIVKYLDKYASQLTSCSNNFTMSIKNYVAIPQGKKDVLDKITRQRIVLKDHFKNSDSQAVAAALDKLSSFMIKFGLAPKYIQDNFVNDPEHLLVVFTYTVPSDGEYSIKINNPIPTLLQNSPLITQIDDKVLMSVPIKQSEEVIEYPPTYLTAGYHEIYLSLSEIQSLVDGTQSFTKDLSITSKMDVETGNVVDIFRVQKEPKAMTFKLPKIDISKTYEISFDYQTIRGSSPQFIVMQDSDPYGIDGKVKPIVDYQIVNDGYSFGWLKQNFTYMPSLNASYADVQIRVPLWNNCIDILSEKKCKDETVRKRFDRDSEVWVGNVKIRNIFTDRLVLEKQNVAETSLGSAVIASEKLNSGRYKLSVNNQKLPYLLVFSETFHTGWQMNDAAGNKLDFNHIVANGYSNAWLVDKELPESVYIEFELQKYAKNGIIITVISLCLLIPLITWMDKRRTKNEL